MEGAQESRPTSHRGRQLLSYVAVALVAAAGSGVGVYAYTQYATHLTVTRINWEVFQNHTSVGFLFNGASAGCDSQCPANAPVGTVWMYALVFPFSMADYNRTVVNVTLPAPFEVLGTSPVTPIRLTAVGNAVSFRVAIQLPADPGTYSVTGAIWET